MPDYGQAVQAGLCALIFLLVLRPIHKSSLVELFRQRVFGLRRDMFLDRVDGHIEAAAAYRLMTTTMNGVIRYAEYITFGRAILGWPSSRRTQDSVDVVELALQQADEVSRERLRKYRAKLYYEIARHMLLTSPLLWCLIALLLPVVLALVVLRLLGFATDGLAQLVSRFGRLSAVRRIAADARISLPDEPSTEDRLLVA